jgi:hypothetical protein
MDRDTAPDEVDAEDDAQMVVLADHHPLQSGQRARQNACAIPNLDVGTGIDLTKVEASSEDLDFMRGKWQWLRTGPDNRQDARNLQDARPLRKSDVGENVSAEQRHFELRSGAILPAPYDCRKRQEDFYSLDSKKLFGALLMV